MKTFCLFICLTDLVLLAACAREPPPISVSELRENPRLLEATLVRCARDRNASRYSGDCVNARYVAGRFEYRARRARDVELEAQSLRKRQALRRTQRAAAEARRRVQEERRLRDDAEQHGIFDDPGLANDTDPQ